MKNFSILQRNYEAKDIFIDEFTDPNEYGKYFVAGSHLTNTNKAPKLHYTYKNSRKTDLLSGLHAFPVVSKRFKEILQEVEVDSFEFYPVDLYCSKTHEIDTSYSFLNILNNIECLDWVLSEFRSSPLAPRVILSVTKLVIRIDVVQTRHVVRMTELPAVVLVSDTLREQIESNRLTGIKFLNIDEYSK